MALQGGMKMIKYLLFLFNFCFVIIGVALIAVGVSTKAGWNEKFASFVKISEFSTPPNILIAVGVLIFIIAFLGCCGAVKEYHWMMMTYSVLVGLILVLELGAAFAAFALQDDARRVLEEGLNGTQYKYNSSDHPDVVELTRSWNMMQQTLHCCGTHNFTDWEHVPNITHIPTSCCRGDEADVDHCTDDVHFDTPAVIAAKTIYTDGCLQKAIDDFAVGTLGIVAIVLAAVELLGVICACMLARSFRYSYETV